jgi:hypothetical protein
MTTENIMNYTIDDYDIKELGRGTIASIHCKVKGYWSSHLITIYIERGYNEESVWNARISYGSGGRDSKEVGSDMEAGRYFAEALTAMCNLADELTSSFYAVKLEAAYQDYRAECRAEFEREQAEKQAKIEADEEMGMTLARNMLEIMQQRGHCRVKLFARGSDRPSELYSSRRANVTFYLRGNRISKLDALKALEHSSIRTAIEV